MLKRLKKLTAITFGALVLAVVMPALGTTVDAKQMIETKVDSVEDLTMEPDLYQSKKLKVNMVNTSICLGEKNALVAQIEYESTTSDVGLYYSVKDYVFNGVSMHDKITFDTSNPYELRVSVKSDIDVPPGVCEVTLIPAGAEGIYREPVKIKFNIVESIYDINVTGPEYVYKAKNEGVSFQIEHYAVNNYFKRIKEPKKVTYYVDIYDKDGNYISYRDYKGDDFSLSETGVVTLGPNFDAEKYNKLLVICSAADYPKNYANGGMYVNIITSCDTKGTAVIADPFRVMALDGDEIGYNELYSGALKIVQEENPVIGKHYDFEDAAKYTYQSDCKDVTISGSGYISVNRVPNKKVTFTATTLDKKTQKSVTIFIGKKQTDLYDLRAHAYVGLHGEFASFDFSSGNCDEKVSYSVSGNKMIKLYFTGKNSAHEFTDLRISVTGGRNLTTQYRNVLKKKIKIGSEYWDNVDMNAFYILPTAKETVITVRCGNQKKTYTFVNEAYTRQKNTTVAKEPRITTSAGFYLTNDLQHAKIYVGKKNAGGTVRFDYDINDYDLKAENAIYHLRFVDIDTEFPIDSEGYIDVTKTGFRDEYFYCIYGKKNSFRLNVNPVSKYQMLVKDKNGNAYAPTLFTFKAIKTEHRTDFNLIKSYNINKINAAKKFVYGVWRASFLGDIGYGALEQYDEYSYYALIKSSGSRTPKDRFTIDRLQTDLAEDLMSGSELVHYMDICMDGDGNYYFGVRYEYAYELLAKANTAILGQGKDVTRYGKDAKLNGYIYITYHIDTADGYVLQKQDKVKVSVTIPKKDWNRLSANK